MARKGTGVLKVDVPVQYRWGVNGNNVPVLGLYQDDIFICQLEFGKEEAIDAYEFFANVVASMARRMETRHG